MSQVLEKSILDTINELFARQKQKSQQLRSGPLSERKALLRKLRQWIMDHRDELHQAVYQDFKKPSVEVETSELFPVLGEISHALDQLESWAKPKR